MLAYVAIILAVVFIIMERTGALDSLIDSINRIQRGAQHRGTRQEEVTGYDPEADERLDVFAQFIDQLQKDNDDEEQGL